MATYPLPAYHFSVEWGGSRTGFLEVKGLDILIDAVAVRDGSSPEDSMKKMPGLRKFSNVILKRGIIKGDNEFFQWINTKTMGSIERRDVVIKLLDDEHAPAVVWTLHDAFPVRYSGPFLFSSDSEIAIEELELVHEGISVEYS
ncbi:MAG: phage tail protein [Bacteroidota bacterium]|nr:phage tail protein [Bacteroidota bacterium]MDP4232953.1 phage tail protein [Bacteroidota bacterium]MDP4241997.1 phage tail protein [Bacteroidota bacterium]MDP4286900.1 phage tail protein [Bacteroidota bacterium]